MGSTSDSILYEDFMRSQLVKKDPSAKLVTSTELSRTTLNRLINPMYTDENQKNLGLSGIQSPADYQRFMNSPQGQGVRAMIAQEIIAEKTGEQQTQQRNLEQQQREVLLKRLVLAYALARHSYTQARASAPAKIKAKKSLEKELEELGKKLECEGVDTFFDIKEAELSSGIVDKELQLTVVQSARIAQ